VLADWDAVSTGPREIDLIPTVQASRFGLPEDQRDAFIVAYGHDIRSWEGYPIICDIRELSTISALLRDGHTDPAARRELQIRLRSLRTGDDRQATYQWVAALSGRLAGQFGHGCAALSLT
jgi:hypothetical protein